MTEENRIPDDIVDRWTAGETGVQPPGTAETNAGVLGVDVEMVKVNPAQDEAFVKLSAEASRMVQYAEAFKIAGVSDVSMATQDLSLIANLTKALEELRRVYTVPLNEHLGNINTAFKAISEPIKEANRLLREKIKAFNQEQERLQAAAEAAQRLRDEAQSIEADLTRKTGQTFEPMAPAPIVDAAPVEKAYTGVGSMGMRRVPHWAVEDESLIPREYFQLDVQKLNKVVKAGLKDIPGIRIWEEKDPVITTRKDV